MREIHCVAGTVLDIQFQEEIGAKSVLKSLTSWIGMKDIGIFKRVSGREAPPRPRTRTQAHQHPPLLTIYLYNTSTQPRK